MEFLGYIISNGGFSMDPKKVQTIVEWVKPSSVRDVQCFLGFANLYRIFVKDYSKIVTPLTRLTGKNKFIWTPEAGRAFQILKIAFTTAPILLHPDPSKPFFFGSRCFRLCTWSCSSQYRDDGRLHPVGFYSRNSFGSINQLRDPRQGTSSNH